MFLLAALRRASGSRGTSASPGRLVLAVPGDVRGLPGPGAFSREATDAGEGALFADAGLGVVPRPVADGVLRWTVYPVPDPGPPPEFVALGQAERDLREQVRQSASVLTSLGVARHRPGVREEIAAALRARPATLWPAGMPGQALRVLQHADEVEAILAAASVDEPGGALRRRPRPWPAGRRCARSRPRSGWPAGRPVAEAVRVLAVARGTRGCRRVSQRCARGPSSADWSTRRPVASDGVRRDRRVRHRSRISGTRRGPASPASPTPRPG